MNFTLDPALLQQTRDQKGTPLLDLSADAPLLLVFLRHLGCTFCREALHDLATRRDLIEASGLRIGLVHMGPEAKVREVIANYQLEDLSRFEDSDKALYAAFQLDRGNVCQLFGSKVWIRGIQAGLLAGHGIGPLLGDGFQMPGVFVVYRGEVTAGFRHTSAADRPDYVAIAREGASTGPSAA